jgi:hypothetical protein
MGHDETSLADRLGDLTGDTPVAFIRLMSAQHLDHQAFAVQSDLKGRRTGLP